MDPQIPTQGPAQMPTQLPPQASPLPPAKTPPGKKSLTKLFLIITSVLAVLLLAGVIVVYLIGNNKSKQQAGTIAKQQQTIDSLNGEIEKLKDGIDDTKLIINELGLQYPKSVINNNIIYIVDLKDKDKPGLYLTTRSLMIAQLNASRLVPPPAKNACGAAEASAGTIVGYRADETINGQKVTNIKNPDLRQIGEIYYFYQKSPSTCSVNNDVEKEQAIATKQAQDFFKSLELKTGE